MIPCLISCLHKQESLLSPHETMILESLALTAAQCSSSRWCELLRQLVAIEKGGCMPLLLLNFPLLTSHRLCFLSDLSVNTSSIKSSTHQKNDPSKKQRNFCWAMKLNQIMEGPMCARDSRSRAGAVEK